MSGKTITGVLVALTLACIGSVTHGQPVPAGQLGHSVSQQQVEGWMKTINNWGRWGKDDQMGTLNLITPAKRKAAAALVKDGITVSLAHDLMFKGDPLWESNHNPPVHKMLSLSGDQLELHTHDFGLTHLDSLCHFALDGKLYNGRLQKDVVSMEHGCSEMGLGIFKDGIVTRGILIDAPRLKGLPFLEPGTRLYRSDIEAWEKKTGLRFGAGDVLILRTGRWALRKAGRMDTPALGATPRSGFDASVIPFLKERDLAVIGGDEGASVEFQDSSVKTAQPLMVFPFHYYALVALGMPNLDAVDPEALAETAARLNRWEFMFTMEPLRVLRGTGIPVNPIAIF
jgi:kynurenine formamidase